MCKRFYSCDIMLVSILVDTRGVGRLGGGKCLVVRSVGVVMTTTLCGHIYHLIYLHYESFPLADWEQEFGSEKVHS